MQCLLAFLGEKLEQKLSRDLLPLVVNNLAAAAADEVGGDAAAAEVVAVVVVAVAVVVDVSDLISIWSGSPLRMSTRSLIRRSRDG